MEKVFKEVAVTGKPDLGGPFVLVDHRGVAGRPNKIKAIHSLTLSLTLILSPFSFLFLQPLLWWNRSD